MNGFEEIQKIIKNFIEESKQAKQQIKEIEKTRMQLAERRNETKNANTSNCEAEISMLGKQISELGNQSQELQNKLDYKFREVKKIVNLTVDNLITENIRKIHKMEEEKQEIKAKISLQEEFYEIFGTTSEPHGQESHKQAQYDIDKKRIQEIEKTIESVETELGKLASIKRDFKNGNWENIIEEKKKIIDGKFEEETVILPFIEEIEVEEFVPIEEIHIEEFEPIEPMKVEEFKPIDEIEIEEFNPIEEIKIEEFEVSPFEKIETIEKEQESVQKIEEQELDEIDEFVKAIVDEIVRGQTQDLNTDLIEEKHETEQEIITYEEEQKVQLTEEFEEEAKLSSIIVKIEEGELVYKLQVSNGKEIKLYPTKTLIGNILLQDKENRKEITENLINYAVAKYKMLDKRAIRKIDPIICEILKIFAEEYNYEASDLIYNYAMSFSKNEDIEIDITIPITYNLSYIDGTKLSKKEKQIILKICRNAIRNEKIDMIGNLNGFGKIKYIFKRLFIANNANALPEGKY